MRRRVRARWIKREREEAERVKDSDLFKTVEEVFDSITMDHVYRLYRKGVIWELKGVISSGKEARVYWAKSREGKDLAVKIYLSATAEFRKSIKKYIVGDPRFEEIPSGNFRRLIYEWARKEYRNLKRMWEAGVRVPRPIAYQANIIVMEFLGENGYRAPLLAEVGDELGPDYLSSLFEDLVAQMELVVCKAGLIHADLSEYNIMVWKDKPWIIDVSQAVTHDHPYALEFLERDVVNVYRYFSERIDLGVSREELLGKLRSCLRV